MKVRITQIPKGQTGLYNPLSQFAELENGEIFQDNEGNIDKVPDTAQSHEEGGVMVDNVNMVLEDTADKRDDNISKKLKMTPDEIEQATGFKPDGSMTHSKAFEKSSEYWDSKFKKIQNKIRKNYEYAKESNSEYAMNSLDLNMKLLDEIPSKEELFNNLFTHQENVKGMATQTKNKYAVGGYTRYSPEVQQLIKEGKLVGINNKDWVGNQHLDPRGYYGTAEEDDFKKRHKWFFDRHPDYTMSNPLHVRQFQKEYNDFYNDNFGTSYFKGNDQYAIDGKFGDYTYGAPLIVYTDNYTQKGVIPNTTTDTYNSQAPVVNRSVGTPIQNEIAIQGELPASAFPNTKSRFNMPLQWYDVAGALNNYIDAQSRIPVRYDPINLKYSPVKYLNPAPQLQAVQESYNAALQQLPSNGVGYANYANLFKTKYSMDNQVLGQYENANNQIYNQQAKYEDQIINQQSQADVLARQTFENKYLTSLDKQAAQKALSFGDLMDTLQKNRKLNNEGTLAMSLIDFYDQNGQYNNNQVRFTVPSNNTFQGNLTPVKGGLMQDQAGNYYKPDTKTGQLIKLKYKP